MDIYRDEITRILNELEEMLDSYMVEYSRQPVGHLICCKSNGNKQFMHVDDSDGGYVRKCINRKPEMIQKLARKKFLTRSISNLEINIQALRQSITSMVSMDPGEILLSMQSAYRSLPEGAFFDSGELPLRLCGDEEKRCRIARHAEWANRDYPKSTFKPEGRRMSTSRGLYVRSKSEVLIVEMFYRYGIPFRYEQVIPVGNREFSMDFTFEDSNGEEFYWEHAGMMDNYDYAESHLRKLRTYFSVGIIPGRNLLISYDRDGNLNMATIEAMIQNEVLPRL